MKFALRWLLIGGGIIIFAGMGFSFYGNFLLDYSLDNLEKALAVSEKTADEVEPVVQNVYQDMIQGIALEEATEEDLDVKNVIFLDLASRSLGEAVERMGNQRAGVYLQEIVKEKKKKRSFLFQTFDEIYYSIKNFYQFLKSMVLYTLKKVFPKEAILEDGVEYSSIFILSQAEQKIEGGAFDEAVELYHKFLKFYPKHKERGFVAISLSSLFVRQKNYEDAERILRQVKKEFSGQEEGNIALSFLNRIRKLEDRKQLIRELQRLIPGTEGTEQGSQFKLKLAIAQFSSYQFEEAENLFQKLMKEPYPDVAQKAQFYLGWLYKITEQLDASTEVLLGLVDSPGILEDMRLGLHVQLADTYYLQNNIEKALDHYQIVSGEEDQILKGLDVATRAWSALADLEKANIYYFDKNDANLGDRSFGRLDGSLFNLQDIQLLQSGMSASSEHNLRNQAFSALASGKVHIAFDLLKKNLNYFPNDPWTHAGLATVYLLFADLKTAQNHALQGYRGRADEYTSSVLAYVYGYMGNFEEAIALYQSALGFNESYIPAQFNLACMHLEKENYQTAYDQLVQLKGRLGRGENFMKSKVYNNIGYALWWLGDRQGARNNFKFALKMTDSFDLARHNLSLIETGDAPRMIDFKGRGRTKNAA